MSRIRLGIRFRRREIQPAGLLGDRSVPEHGHAGLQPDEVVSAGGITRDGDKKRRGRTHRANLAHLALLTVRQGGIRRERGTPPRSETEHSSTSPRVVRRRLGPGEELRFALPFHACQYRLNFSTGEFGLKYLTIFLPILYKLYMDNVLLVEDDAIFRAVYHHCLRAIDPRIILVECENGYEALQCLLKETPRLIVLDLHMPALDGNDFIRVVKHKPEYAQLPIIVITSDRGERTLQLTDLPNVHLLFKPVDAHSLDALIRQTIQPSLLSAERDAPSSVTAGTEYLIRNEARIQRELALIFYDIVPGTIAELQQAELRAGLTNPDYSALREWIHTMRGTCSLIDAPPLLVLVEQLSVAVKNQDLQQVSALMPQIRTSMQRIAIDLYLNYNLQDIS